MTEYNSDNIVNFGAYEKARKGAGNNDGGKGGGDWENRLSAVEHKMDILVKDSAEIKGRLMNMPTTLQWLSIIVAMIFTIMAASFALIRFGLPH